MSRLDYLNESYVETMLRDLDAEVNALKSSKQLIGGNSLVFSTSDSGSTYDWTGNLTTPGGAAAPHAALEVTATALTQDNVFADLVPQLFVNGVRYTRADYYNNVAPASFYNVHQLQADLSDNRIRRWKIDIVGALTTTTYGMKFYIVASDQVSINVVQVA